jgi:hypothetical protein
MKKLKIKRKGFGFQILLEGEVEIDNTKIKPYEQYMSEEIRKQTEKQIFDYLLTIVPMQENEHYGMYEFSRMKGGEDALARLAAYLADSVEDE